MTQRTKRIVIWTGAVALAVALLGVIGLAALPVAPFKSRAEAALSDRFGRPVTIETLDRTPAFSFTPTIHARGVRVPQAAWAGSGDLARIASLDVRIRVLDLLTGDVQPRAITLNGARLNLVRAADGRVNWKTGQDESGRGSLKLDGLVIRDTVVSYRDAKQDRRFTLALTADGKGLEASGTGNVRGADVRVTLAGAPVTEAGGAWPFQALIDGPALAMSARGTMDSPLDTDRMTLTMTARANSLKLIDAVVEAGLFGTQPVRLSAAVQHAGPVWKITDLTGTIGRSRLAGHLDVDKSSGRTKLDGAVHFRALDFDDLADDAGLAAAAALERRIGPRVVPNTRVDISKIDGTDGRIAVRIDRILSRSGATALRNASGTLALDRQLLTIAPLRVGLPRGTIDGKVVVDQRNGRNVPLVTLALDLRGSSIAALTGGGDVSGRLDARVRLTGAGSTVRDAVARSNGSIGVVARDGALPAKMAAMLGFDAGRVLTADDGARATLRCAVVRMEMRGGRGSFSPLIVDTSASQTRGAGGVAFPVETIQATLTGAPKHGSILRIPGSVTAGGTLSNPQVTVPRQVKSVTNILKGLGRAITGHQGPTATDADCAALSARAIGR